MSDRGAKAVVGSLVLDPDLARVAEARRFVAEVATEGGFAEERIFDITVACSEAVANAIEHAPVKGQVRVSTALYEDRLEVTVEGPGEFQAPASLRERASRGLGLPLMAKLSDHLMLHSGPDGGTLVGLTFYRPGFVGRGGHVASGLTGTVPASAVWGERRCARYLEAVFESARTPLALLDPKFDFLRVNEAYARATGRGSDEFTGHNHFELYPSDARTIFEEVVRSKESFVVDSRPFEFADHPEWGVTYWDLCLTPLLDEAGEVEALVLGLKDATGTRLGEERAETRPEGLRGLWSRMIGRLLARRKAGLVILVGALLQVLVFWGLSLLDSPRYYLGIPGPAATLIAIGVALVAGPLAGAAVALVGGAAYIVLLTEFGEAVVWPTIIVSIALWTLASVVAALVADRVREQAQRREIVLSQAVSDRDALMTSLRASEGRQREAAEENARLYRGQQEIAETLQLAFLHIPSQIGRLRLGHVYRSATESALVGGDFYDVFAAKEGKIVALIGDVAGHGIRAARTATLVKDVVHAFAHEAREPEDVLKSTNGLLVEKDLKGFVTLFLGILDSNTGRFRFASAGHPTTFIKRRSGDVEALGGPSPPLGVFSDASWHQAEVDLESGDSLLLYTDGLIEARRGDEFFGEAGLRALLARDGTTVEELPNVILDEVLKFSAGSLRDDVAILAVSLGSEPQRSQ